MSQTLGDTTHRNDLAGVSRLECLAMRILYSDGWSLGELKLTFQLSQKQQVRTHVNGDCTHDFDSVDLYLLTSGVYQSD